MSAQYLNVQNKKNNNAVLDCVALNQSGQQTRIEERTIKTALLRFK
jgi:hypothetical protein